MTNNYPIDYKNKNVGHLDGSIDSFFDMSNPIKNNY